MARIKTVDGVVMDLTAEDEAQCDADAKARDAEELAWANEKPMNDWKSSMQETDNGMPRYMEDLITANSDFTIPEKMKTRYDEKVALRATKP